MRFFLIPVLLAFFCTSAFAADKGITTTKKTAADSGKQRRLALIIGNSAYQHSGALANPTRDAELIAKTLKDVGFDLHGGGAQLDLSRRSLDQVIESFGDSIKPGDVALFYYSGHGLQVAGENYLVPVDANIKKESEVRVKTVPINLLFAKLDGIPGAVNIVVLDACRNNPFARSFRSSGGGLAQMSAPTGTLVAFSTSPGQVAEDGSGNNSTYTASLAKYLKEPGLLVEQVFKRVRSEVMGATNGVQTPWENTSLTGSFKFIDAAAMEAVLARQGAAKSAELERLLKMEEEAKAAKDREQAELAKRQAELEKMDAEIEAMKARLGAGKADANDSLDNMVAMVQQRAVQAERLASLKKEKEFQERKRQEEISRLKAAEKEKRRKEIEKNIAKYELVINSPYGKDMADAAWQSLIKNHGEASKLKKGDLESFRKVAIEGVSISKLKKQKRNKERLRKLSLAGEFVKVPGGCFKMGVGKGVAGTTNKPQHEVCVDSFYMGKYEITQDQWKKVMGNNPSKRKKGGKYPVEMVTFQDIKSFIKKLSKVTGKRYRLPTEAEWEYAATNGGKHKYYAGDGPLSAIAWTKEFDKAETHPIGLKKPNGFGLYDMTGNVSEFCQDWWSKDYYKVSPKRNPKGPDSGTLHVVRGGDFWSSVAWLYTRSRSNDHWVEKRGGSSGVGFRLVAEK